MLPKYILVVLDDDLIEFLKFEGVGMSQMLGHWLTWLMKEFKSLIDKRKGLLPAKAKRHAEPCIYWFLAPLHWGFTNTKNESRKKLNFCMESILKGRSDMRVIRFKDKDIWDYNDKSLVTMNRLTDVGLYTYWQAVDAAFKFNALHHELFLAKSKCSVKQEKPGGNEASKEEKPTASATVHDRLGNETNPEENRWRLNRDHHPDDMANFFRRHRDVRDKFHWHKDYHSSHKPCSGNRFLLPKVHYR